MGPLPVVDPPRPRWWTQVLLVVGFAWAYDEVRSLHGNVVAVGIRHGWWVLHLDRVLHLNWSPSLNRWVEHHDALADLLSGYYVVMHLGVTALVLLLLYLHGSQYRRQRDVLLLASLIGLAVYWVYPTAPPRLLGGQFHDTVATVLPFAYRVETASANLYAAIPSLHMAWSVWAAIAVCSMTTRWWLRLIAIAHPVVTGFTVLATGNHFTIDLLTGTALTLVSYPLLTVGAAATSRAPAWWRAAAGAVARSAKRLSAGLARAGAAARRPGFPKRAGT